MDNPVITIGGRDFPVPHLGLGAFPTVMPALMRLNAMNIETPTAENIDDLNTVAYLGICRGTPTFAKADFMNLPGTFEELLLAKVVVAKQCGMTFKPQADDPGEALAGK